MIDYGVKISFSLHVETETVNVGEALTGIADDRNEEQITGNVVKIEATRGETVKWTATVADRDDGWSVQKTAGAPSSDWLEDRAREVLQELWKLT